MVGLGKWALCAAALALAACTEDSQRHAKRVFQQQVTNDGKLVKGVYLGKADTELTEATRDAIRRRQSLQQF
jgi:hypothetical protein